MARMFSTVITRSKLTRFPSNKAVCNLLTLWNFLTVVEGKRTISTSTDHTPSAPDDLRVQEFEAIVQREGDMGAQFPKSARSNYFVASGAGGKIMDFISFTLNTANGPCRNGKTTWNIPTRFEFTQNSAWNKMITMTPFQMDFLTVQKGGCVLLEFQIE